MSFTAEVKDELSRIESEEGCCQQAELAALVRIEGTLHITGPGASSGSRSRPRPHRWRARRSSCCTASTTSRPSSPCGARVLHKTNNYLITVPSQTSALPQALRELGILDDSMALTYGILPRVVRRDCCAIAYLRGAFLGGGFVADPHGDFHFELTAESEQLAEDLVGAHGALRDPPPRSRSVGACTRSISRVPSRS